jgi:predicted metal-dependent hydrolase
MADSVLVNIRDVGPVLLERSARAKHLNISVKPFKGIRVAVPEGLSFKNAEIIARMQVDWLKTHLEQVRKFEAEHPVIPEVEIDPRKARDILVSRLAAIARKHGYTYSRVTVRNQKTRWGSCSSRNSISLNMKLTLLPDELRDFVILHELVHTRIKNHGKDFWAEMTRAEPRAKELDKRLNQYYLRML